jgi:hypothetical protein
MKSSCCEQQDRDLISAGASEQNLNPGSNLARAKRDHFDLSLLVGAAGGMSTYTARNT